MYLRQNQFVTLELTSGVGVERAALLVHDSIEQAEALSKAKGHSMFYLSDYLRKRYRSERLFRRRIYPEGCYTIPAGHLNKDESSEIAVLREIYEETKLLIIPSVVYEVNPSSHLNYCMRRR